MTQQTINIGNQPGDGTGDPARTAFTKVNQNFTEVYANATPGGSIGQIQYKLAGTSFGGFTASGDATINTTTGVVTVSAPASRITNTPSGTIAATDVQSAINEIVSDLSASSGSSLVGFLQSGTSAVTRTVQDKERDVVSVKDFGATGDGTTDDTVAFSSARTAAGVNGQVVVPVGVYKLTNLSLNIAGQEWVFAKGAIVRSSNKLTTHAITISADSVKIIGGTFDNQATSADAYADISCLRVSNANNVIIQDGVYKAAIGPVIGVSGANKISIVNNTFYDTWYAAIFVLPASANIENIYISENRIYNETVFAGYKYGIDVHSDAGNLYNINNVVVSNNQIYFPTSSTQYPLHIEIYGGAAVPGKISKVNVCGNSVYNGGIGISLSQVNDACVTGNTASLQYLYGIETVNPYTVTISGNSINGSQRGIAPSGAGSNLSISGNSIRNTTTAGIYVSQVGANVSITGNVIYPSSNYGIHILQTAYWSITSNVLEGNSVAKKAILLDQSDKGTITGNTVSNWTENGILILSTAATTYNRIAATSNVFFNTANSLNLATQLSGGAAIGSFVSYINNFSDSDSTYRRDYLDVLNNRISFSGAGSPESIIAASRGSMYYRTDGGAATTLYIKESGTGNTGWVAK